MAPALPTSADPLAGLGAALEQARGGDRLAPATVVAPSEFAALFVRRALGARAAVANVEFTTVAGVVRSLGGPGLAGAGLRTAPRAVELEGIRVAAQASGGRLGGLAGHHRVLAMLQGAFEELRRCPPAVVDSLGRRGGSVGEVVTLFGAVRRGLREAGFADSHDLVTTARERARGGGEARRGPLVGWSLGVLAPLEREMLDALGEQRRIEAVVPAAPGPVGVVRPCRDPDEEVRTAIRVLLEGLESGVALWDQAVLHPGGPGYARTIHQQLAAAGLPANGPELRRLDRSTTGRALLGLLELAGGDWPRREVVAWLSSAPITDGPGGGAVPASRWDTLSATAGVVRGPTQWSERLGRLARQGGGRADGAADLERFMAELIVRTRPGGRSWGQLVEWSVGLLDHYLDPTRTGHHWPAVERAAAEQVRGSVRALAELDRVSSPADLGTFRRTVRAQLEAAPLDTGELPEGGFGDGVFVAPMAMARGLRFRTVVVVGLADGLVPGPTGDEVLLPEEIRRLDGSGGLRTRAMRLAERHDDLVAALQAGVGSREVSYPSLDPRTGREQLASRWLAGLTDPGTSWEPVASFTAGLASLGPAATARELDLRELERWRSGGGDPGEAPAVESDPGLLAGFEAVRARAGPEFSRFDGRVGVGTVSAFDPAAPVSATRLETYAECPRRYLLGRVLEISKQDLPEELWRIAPMERGTLVHAILEAYVLERLAGSTRSLDRLLELAEEHFGEAEAAGLVGKALLWRIDRAVIRRDLRRFHVEEGDLRPIAAELAFGGQEPDGDPAVTVTLEDGRQVAFRGRADRVDRTPAGHLVVSDYKTGKQTGLKDLTGDPVMRGTRLQLPLYGMAARARFGGEGPVHARYWLLSGDRSASCYHLRLTEAVEDRFRQVVGLVADGIEAGVFPGIPGPPLETGYLGCNWCDFNSVCPPGRDRQWARKRGGRELAPIAELLDGPLQPELQGAVVRGFVDPETTR